VRLQPRRGPKGETLPRKRSTSASAARFEAAAVVVPPLLKQKLPGPSPALARPPGPLAGQLLQAIEPKIVDARLAAHIGNLVE